MSTIEMTVTARTFRELQAEIKESEAQDDALKQKMIAEMDARGIDEMAAGEYTIRWNLYESSRLDTAKLKADHGDIYAEYSKRTTSTRFQVAQEEPRASAGQSRRMRLPRTPPASGAHNQYTVPLVRCQSKKKRSDT